MEQFISLFILIPLVGFIINAIIPKKDEKLLSQVSFGMLGVQFISVLIFTVTWWLKGAKQLYQKQFTFLEIDSFELYIDFVFDQITAVFLLVGSFVAFLITTYSRNYLHREDGFKRFFTTVLFFYLGYNVIVLSGNLATIFVGWEIAGISSFLLIAYYRNRFIPVKNAVKIFSVYRLGDIALMLAMWTGHHIWHKSISLHVFGDEMDVVQHIHHAPGLSVLFVCCIFMAAAIKSAQFPFSSWLPRAMEGPTPSSAIFYSSLAVHLGVLVLLRTYDFWIHVPWMQFVIIFTGGLSFLLSSIAARIQPSVKGQIAYAVVAQVGLMAIEVALGWHIIVLVHFASHAMLRSYQLLISPSLVSYAIKKQFFEYSPVKRVRRNPFIQNLSNSLYILSLNEWYQDGLVYQLVWGPFKRMGLLLQKVPVSVVKIVSFSLVIIVPTLTILVKLGIITLDVEIISAVFITVAFLYILRVFTEKERVLHAWYKLAFFHFFIVSGMFLNGINVFQLSFYVGGVIISYLLGHYALGFIRKNEKEITLSGYQGHCYEYPFAEFLFFVACLGLMGFPITSAFVGLELILNSVAIKSWYLLSVLLLCFFVNGLAMIRIYSRIFLGPHVKTYHTSARKSS